MASDPKMKPFLVRCRRNIPRGASLVRASLATADPNDTILDVGVSGVLNDGANVLERKYDYKEQIVACDIGSVEEFQQNFPMVRFIRIEANKPFPFHDLRFDIATAVLEDVGSRQNQKLFVAELGRVAKRVFISVRL
jgi:hypothetical protein